VVEAAIKVGIQHLIAPDSSSETFNEHVEELIIFELKIKAQKISRGEGTRGQGCMDDCYCRSLL
jgi:hypothetical protein